MELRNEVLGIARRNQNRSGILVDPIRLELTGEGSGGVELREIGPGDDVNVGDDSVPQDQNHVAPGRVDLLVPDLQIACLLDVVVDVGMTKPRVDLRESGWGGVAECFAHRGFRDLRSGSHGKVVQVVESNELVPEEGLQFRRAVEQSRQLRGRRVVDGRLKAADLSSDQLRGPQVAGPHQKPSTRSDTVRPRPAAYRDRVTMVGLRSPRSTAPM